MGRVAKPKPEPMPIPEQGKYWTSGLPPATPEEIEEGAMILWGVYHVLCHGDDSCLFQRRHDGLNAMLWREARPIVAEMMARRTP